MNLQFDSKNAIPILMLIASAATIIWFLYPQYGTIQDLRTQQAQYQQALDNANQVRILRDQLLAKYDSFSATDWNKLMELLPDAPDGVQLARDTNGIANIFNLRLKKFSFDDAGAAVHAGGGGIGTGIGGGGTSAVAAPSTGSGTGVGIGGAAPSAVAAPSSMDQAAAAPVMPRASTGVLEMKMSLVSPYADFTRFLRELEKSLELSDVVGLEVARISAQNSGTPVALKSAGKSAGTVTPASGPSYQFDLTVHTYWLK